MKALQKNNRRKKLQPLPYYIRMPKILHSTVKKQMSGSVFLDTNILVYAHTDIAIAKQTIAPNLITNSYCFISTQVLQELANTLHRKFRHDWGDVSSVLANALGNNNLHVDNYKTISTACEIAARYGYSFYDSLVLSSAIECGCTRIYTEDLHDGQIIDGKLTIENPFKQ